MTKKKFLLILHAHIPYVLHTVVEYWLYEAVLDSYLPFLFMLKKLEAQMFHLKITLNISPILLVQFQDVHFKKGFEDYLELRKTILEMAIKLHENNHIFHKDLEHFHNILSFYRSFNSDIISIYRHFINQKILILLTSAVTHPFLSGMEKFPKLINLQINIGKIITKIFFGSSSGFWSPECSVFPDLPIYLKNNELSYFFADQTAISTAKIDFRNNIFQSEGIFYLVRDFDSTMKIWDNENGYPGHSVYRDFHSDIAHDILQIAEILSFHKLPMSGISGVSISDKFQSQKNIYNYTDAKSQIEKDSSDYISYLESLSYDLIPVFFDMELFGHWWKEGIQFLESFFLKLSLSDHLETNSFENLNLDIQEYRPKLSTWGSSSNAESWINKDTVIFWEKIFFQNIRAEKILTKKTKNKTDYDFLIKTLLAQASDWMFLISKNSFRKFSQDLLNQYLNYNTSILQNTFLHDILFKNY